jgi:hypothetical protein
MYVTETTQKNKKITLEGKTTCRTHNDTRKFGSRESLTRAVEPGIEYDFLLNSSSDFLLRRLVAFSSNIILIFPGPG